MRCKLINTEDTIEAQLLYSLEMLLIKGNIELEIDGFHNIIHILHRDESLYLRLEQIKKFIYDNLPMSDDWSRAIVLINLMTDVH